MLSYGPSAVAALRGAMLAAVLGSSGSGSMHLRNSAGVGKFLSRLPRMSFVGLAAPDSSRLVDGRLAGAYALMADRVEQLSAGFGGGSVQLQQGQCGLKLQHFSQIVFGRLDLAAHAADAAA
ncbi:hypothetical protein OEZ86_002028 [Tetradesmus obliquus]|nr:hypothetical protein OEZ86_002028 [Tetradesmus obliquus]